MIKLNDLSATLIEKFSGPARGIAVVDLHGEGVRIDELISSIAPLKEKGLTHFFWEMTEPEHQDIVDRFMRTGETEELRKYLQKRRWDSQTELKKHLQATQQNSHDKALAEDSIVGQYVELARELGKHGIKIQGIDKQAKLTPACLLIEDSSNFQEFRQQDILDRNKHWVKIVKNKIAGVENSRFIVFGGAGHFYSLPMKAGLVRASVSENLSIEKIEFEEDQKYLNLNLKGPEPLFSAE